MTDQEFFSLWQNLGFPCKSHPWHGVEIGKESPECLTVYIEIVPTDNVKYELDKKSGHLRVDRPQRYSNVCPTLYGLIPQTYCGQSVAELSAQANQSSRACWRSRSTRHLRPDRKDHYAW